MERKGICTNVGPCTMVGKVQIITDDDGKQNYICYNQSKKRRSDGVFQRIFYIIKH